MPRTRTARIAVAVAAALLLVVALVLLVPNGSDRQSPQAAAAPPPPPAKCVETERKVERGGYERCVIDGERPTIAAARQGRTKGSVAGGSFGGETAQGRSVTFTVSGDQVVDFQAGVNTWCSTTYNNRLVPDVIANVPPLTVGPDGTFAYEGPPETGNMKVTGQVTGGTATGVVGLFRGDTNYSGGQLYIGNCSAVDVAWSAAAG